MLGGCLPRPDMLLSPVGCRVVVETKKPIIPCYTQPVVTKEVDGGGYYVVGRIRNTVAVDKLKLGPN